MWDALYVNELNHAYTRYKLTGNISEIKEAIREGIESEVMFKVAFCCGLADYLKRDGVFLEYLIVKRYYYDIPLFPPLYSTPAFVKKMKEYEKKSIPEFKKYGIIINKIGDSA